MISSLRGSVYRMKLMMLTMRGLSEDSVTWEPQADASSRDRKNSRFIRGLLFCTKIVKCFKGPNIVIRRELAVFEQLSDVWL